MPKNVANISVYFTTDVTASVVKEAATSLEMSQDAGEYKTNKCAAEWK